MNLTMRTKTLTLLSILGFSISSLATPFQKTQELKN